MFFNFFKNLFLVTIFLVSQNSFAETTCFQDSDGSWYVKENAVIFNGKNGNALKRCGMSRRDQGSAPFKSTTAPPAATSAGSITVSQAISDPATFTPTVGFVVPPVSGATGARVTIYSGSSPASLSMSQSTNIAPGSSYSSPTLVPGTYYAFNIQYENNTGLGADVRAVSPILYDPCNGKKICNPKIIYQNPKSPDGNVWNTTVYQSKDGTQRTTANVAFVAASKASFDVCLAVKETVWKKITVNTVGPQTLSAILDPAPFNNLQCALDTGCTVKLIPDCSPSEGSPTVKAEWNSVTGISTIKTP
jgi:hypothetical protein